MEKEKFAYKKGYRITESGDVISHLGNKLKPMTDNRGYYYFHCRRNTKLTRIHFHRLQAFQKYGDDLFEDGIVSRHLNGIKSDNSWSNISIGTHSENRMDMPKEVRQELAEHATSFFKKYNHEKVINYYNSSDDITYEDVMKEFNIPSKGTISYIMNK